MFWISCFEFIKINNKVQKSKCNKDDEANQCFSFPDYPCCESCEVVEEDKDGKWGIEKNSWCGLKDSCSKSDDKNDKSDDKSDKQELPPLDRKYQFHKLL